jgi:uncharacterized protein (TIGR02271 family)
MSADHESRNDVSKVAGEPFSPRAAVEITRSEEQLSVQMRRTATGRVRLTKRIVTETVTETHELRHEILDVEHLDADSTGDDADDTTAGDDPVIEIVLRREQLEVVKRLVAYERVRVHKDVVAAEQTIDAELRKERIDVEPPSR